MIKGYTIINYDIFNKQLSASEFYFLAVVQKFSNIENNLKNSTLQKITGLSERQVIRVKNSLIKKDLIEIIKNDLKTSIYCKNLDSKRYVKVPDSLFSIIGPDFNYADFRFLVFLNAYTFNGSELSVSFIAKGLGLSERAVSSTKAKLLSYRLIHVKHLGGKSSDLVWLNKDRLKKIISSKEKLSSENKPKKDLGSEESVQTIEQDEAKVVPITRKKRELSPMAKSYLKIEQLERQGLTVEAEELRRKMMVETRELRRRRMANQV